MHKIKSSVLVATIIFLLGTASQAVSAESRPSEQLVVIMVDRQALAQSEDGTNLVESLVGLTSTLRVGQRFAFATLDQPDELLGPAVAGEIEFTQLRSQLRDWLSATGSGRSPDLAGSLTQTYNLLSNRRAAPGSTVYLITGGTHQSDLYRVAARLAPLMRVYRDTGWSIVGLSLPGASQELRDFLAGISAESGGAYFELSVPNGFKSLADKILSDGTNGRLFQLADGVLGTDEVLTSSLSIAPGTRETTLVFIKEGRYGSLRLSNPDGFEASKGDRTASSVVESPYVVTWTLLDPVAGQWTVEVRGIDGVLSAWHYSASKYGLSLQSYGAVPLNKPSSLVAYVTDEQSKVTLDGVVMIARVTTPAGAILVHELNDEGLLGDSMAGDGYFSKTIPPVTAEGEYGVELELYWPNIDHRITSGAQFRAQAFPEIQVTPGQVERLRPGETSQVATIMVHIQGQPYAISTEELTADVANGAETAGFVEIRPQHLLTQGRAWLFDVFFTPLQGGFDTLIFRLDLEYSDKQYSDASDSLVLSSVTTPSVAPVVASAPVVPPPTLPQTPPSRPTTEPAGFPWGLVSIPIALVIALVTAAVYWRTRTYPHGYLYNDRDELIVDFANLQRHPIAKLLFRNSVRGKELGIAGLDGLLFKFLGKTVGLRSKGVTPTVRVNNQPLLGQTLIQDTTWIGTHGKLYSFLFTAPDSMSAPGTADD